MSDYVFLQSQDPFTETQTLSQYQLIHNLATKDNRVTLYLIQNGVMPARRARCVNRLICSAIKISTWWQTGFPLSNAALNWIS